MRKLVPYLPAISSFLAGAGLQLSGIKIPILGYSLVALASILLLVPAWPSLRGFFSRFRLQMPITFASDSSGAESLNADSERYTFSLLPYLLLSQLTVLDFNGLAKDDPYFEVGIVVWNLASFSVTFDGVAGRVRVNYQDCNTPATLITPGTIPGTNRVGQPNPEQRHFNIRQVITAKMAESILVSLRETKPVPIDLPSLRWVGTVHLSTKDISLPNQHPILKEQLEVVGPLPTNGQFSYRGIFRLTAS